MKISIDTKEDSHEEIKKVIKMLQNLVGETQEIFTNEPVSTPQETTSAFNNIFGDASSAEQVTAASETTQTQSQPEEEISQSTEDLFAELFSEEEIKKMDTSTVKEEEEDEEEELPKSKDKKFNIEFY